MSCDDFFLNLISGIWLRVWTYSRFALPSTCTPSILLIAFSTQHKGTWAFSCRGRSRASGGGSPLHNRGDCHPSCKRRFETESLLHSVAVSGCGERGGKWVMRVVVGSCGCGARGCGACIGGACGGGVHVVMVCGCGECGCGAWLWCVLL